MRTVAVVSSCHRRGFETYGRRMLESFDQHWPQPVPLLFYAEDFVPDVRSARILVRDLLPSCPGLADFKQRHAGSVLAHGASRKWRPRLRLDHYQRRLRLDGLKWGRGFRWNAVRFAHKSFAVFHAARNCAADVLVWVDADMVFFDDIAPREIESWIPADRLVGYLKRPTWSECGLVAYNLRHPQTAAMLSEFETLYTTDSLFRQDEFHDSYLFDRVRERAERRGAVSHDIAEGIGFRAEHVLINSRLGRYMDHLKGPRKERGRSSASDLIVHRDERYWSPDA